MSSVQNTEAFFSLMVGSTSKSAAKNEWLHEKTCSKVDHDAVSCCIQHAEACQSFNCSLENPSRMACRLGQGVKIWNLLGKKQPEGRQPDSNTTAREDQLKALEKVHVGVRGHLVPEIRIRKINDSQIYTSKIKSGGMGLKDQPTHHDHVGSFVHSFGLLGLGEVVV